MRERLNSTFCLTMTSTFQPPAADHQAKQPPADPAQLAIDDAEEIEGFTRWLSQPDGSRIGRSQFQVSGMFCIACARTIEAALTACPGVVDARVNGSSARAQIDWAPERTRPSALVAAIRDAGYHAAPDLAAPARLLRQRAERQGWWRLFVAGFCMMQVMMYATPIYVAAPGEMPADQMRLLQWAGWLLTLPVLLFSAGPLYAGAWQSLRRRRITMELPVVLGLSIAFFVSTGATFDPGGVFGHEVWFDSVTMFVFLLLGARSLELAARHRAAATLEAAMASLPDRVERLLDDGGAEVVSVRRLRAGDRVRVAIGQAFPADGSLLEGHTQTDESLLSGESAAVSKRAHDAVLAGSINLRAPVLMRVERIGDETRHAEIVALMRQAASERPPSVRSVDRLAAPFLWGVLLLAAAAAVAWSFIDPSRVVLVAVAVLIVTCPCAISLATPSALLAGGSALARLGLLPRSLGFIETLARVDTVIFDKTGTLTDDSLNVRGTLRLDAPVEYDLRSLLGMAAGLARWSTHPASKAVAGAVMPTGSAPAHWHEIEEIPGEGLQASDASGRLFRLGRRSWVCAETSDQVHHCRVDGSTSGDVYFGPIGQPWLGFELSETLRTEALDAVRQLRAQGMQLMIASGDHPSKVALVAQRLGIEQAHGGLRPEHKLQLLQTCHAAGRRVLMIGDGLNDGPVLARADVSIALGNGSHLSQLQSDAVLLSTRLTVIADARLLALQVRRVIRQNMAWAVGYNLVCVPLALAGFLPPWAAGAGMAASSLVVVINALRIGRISAANRRCGHSIAGPSSAAVYGQHSVAALTAAAGTAD